MRGFNVLYPMGYDAFGLPAENAAIEHQVDPEKWTRDNIEAIKRQQEEIGLSYDWTRQLQSCDEDYYKWNQWIFLKFYEKGLVYRENAYVNWCPSCTTVLANEQVINNKCWRCSTEVEQRELKQWFFKIRDYAEELLAELDTLEWPEKVKLMQRNWIGRSEGTRINFKIKDTDEIIPIFTTRADTLYGVTFMVFAPEHPLVRKWVRGTKYETAVNKFLKEVQRESKFERTAIDREKRGMFINKYAINPINGEEVPVFIGNFVIYEYGAGAVMAVPAHDQRDFEFAKTYNIPIKIVIQPYDYTLEPEKMTRAFIEDGYMVNSGEFNGLNNREAAIEISKKLEAMGNGKRTVNYKLRDWLISRQRYWGTPIPIVYCESCGTVPVPYEQLPVKLPKDVKFTGSGNPLATSDSFVYTRCPQCGRDGARRETDTMDTFIDSAWYFLRYCSPKHQELPFSRRDVDYWLPVDQYIGGIEHAIMHLLYARFFVKALRDLDLLSISEPFQRLLCQGMVNKETPYCETCNKFLLPTDYKDNKCKSCNNAYVLKSAKMSKSLGNVVDPKVLMDKYGADVTRFFILFDANPEKELEWSDQGIESVAKFILKTYELLTLEPSRHRTELTVQDELILFNMHKTIKLVTEYIDTLMIRDALNCIMQFINELKAYSNDSVHLPTFRTAVRTLTLLLSPITPHLCEEVWEQLGNRNFVATASWPTFDPRILTVETEQQWNLLHNLCKDINEILKVAKIDKPKLIKLFIATAWKYKFVAEFKSIFATTHDRKKLMHALMAIDELKRHGAEINNIIGRFITNPELVPSLALTSDSERRFFERVKPILKSRYNCEIIIGLEAETDERKARQALPGKPAILID
jgi:leucyl-tRNA synthetase